MKSKTLFFCFSILFFLHPPLFSRDLNGDGDFQLWLHPIIHKKLDKKSALYYVGDYRFGADASILYHFYSQVTYRRKFGEHFEIGPGFRQSNTLDRGENIWFARSEPMFDFYFHFEQRKVKFLFRSRTQFQIEEVGTNDLQQRFQFLAQFPFKIAQFSPYIYDEIFFRKSQGFSQNRFSVGAVFPITSKLEGNMHYILRRNREARWVQHNIFRIQIEYTF